MAKPPFHWHVVKVALLLGTSCCIGCGGTTAALISGLTRDSSGSNQNADAQNADAQIILGTITARTAPAKIPFRLEDEESDPVSVSFFIRGQQAPDCSEQIQVAIFMDAGESNSVPATGELASSPSGISYTAEWDFEEFLACRNKTLIREVRIEIRGTEADRALTPACGEIQDLGNDPPEVEFDDVASEKEDLSGIVLIPISLVDSSSDGIPAVFEYATLEGGRVSAFRPATSLTDLPPCLSSSPGGTTFQFFWESLVDLGNTERQVRFRVRYGDTTLPPDECDPEVDPDLLDCAVTRDFFVDNNSPPTLVLDEAIFENPDERRGIPIPFQVLNGNLDSFRGVDVVFQWTRTDEPFRDLPTEDLPALRDSLRDPEFRREHRICTEIPTEYPVIASPIGQSALRIPALSSSALPVVDLSGPQSPRLRGTLEILRPSAVPVLQSESWSQTAGLSRPVAALPTEDGLGAFVLEDLGSSWQLRHLRLSDGSELAPAARGNGRPTAAAFEWNKEAVLIALDLPFDGIQIRRVPVSLSSPVIPANESGTLLLRSPGAHSSTKTDVPLTGPIRGIASLGPNTLVFSIQSHLVLLRRNPAENTRDLEREIPDPRIEILAADLETPWGLAPDPLESGRVYVVENGRERILQFDIRTRDSRSLPILASRLSNPTQIAIDPSGFGLLLAIDCNPNDSSQELLEIDVSPAASASNFPSQARTSLLVENLPGPIAGVAIGDQELRLAALPQAPDIAIGGGVLERRDLLEDVQEYEVAQQIVRFSTALRSPLLPVQHCRILQNATPISGTQTGSTGVFAWNSGDVRSGGGIRIRGTAFDSDLGSRAETSPKQVMTPLDNSFLDFPANEVSWIATGDLDKDFDLDFVLGKRRLTPGSEPTISIHRQTERGEFTETVLPNFHRTVRSLTLADLDGDTNLDIVFSTSGEVFYALGAGVAFEPPTPLDDACAPPSICDPTSVRVVDLDQNGHPDILTADSASDTISVFFQEPNFVFSSPMLLRGSQTDGPVSLDVADFNGDGQLDIVSANRRSKSLTIFFQTRNIRNPKFTALPVATETGDILSVRALDIDRDGDIDIVATDFSNRCVHLYRRRLGIPDLTPRDPAVSLSGSFSREMIPVVGRPRFFDVLDIDRDGRLDILATTVNPQSLLTILQTRNSGFPLARSSPLGSSSRDPFITTADFDGDGTRDVLIADGETKASILFQRPVRFFRSEPLVVGAGHLRNPTGLKTADIDSNGLLDFVTVNSDSKEILLFVQARPGSFNPTPIALTSSTDCAMQVEPRAIELADLNRDGLLDVVSVGVCVPEGQTESERLDVVTLFRQQKDGSFTKNITLPLNHPLTDPAFIAIADFNRDQRLDIGVTVEVTSPSGVTSFQLQIIRQRPGGSLLPGGEELIDLGIKPSALRLAHLNGNGILDIALASAKDRGARVLFDLRRPRPLDELPNEFKILSDIAIGDLNRDGRPEIVLSDFSHPELLIFSEKVCRDSQDRCPGLTRSLPLEPCRGGPDGVPSIRIADLDRDGRLDIVAGRRQGQITILYQRPNGRFEEGQQLLCSSPSLLQIEVVDIDGDGDLDVSSLSNTNFDVHFGGR